MRAVLESGRDMGRRYAGICLWRKAGPAVFVNAGAGATDAYTVREGAISSLSVQSVCPVCLPVLRVFLLMESWK